MAEAHFNGHQKGHLLVADWPQLGRACLTREISMKQGASLDLTVSNLQTGWAVGTVALSACILLYPNALVGDAILN